MIWRELRAVLDEEINRLPMKDRQAIVLCDLQGRTHHQAAQELGWPSGSLSRRLARGRALLRAALERRNLGLPAMLATVVSVRAVPGSLQQTTLQAVAGFQLAATASLATPRALSLVGHWLQTWLRTRLPLLGLGTLVLLATPLGVCLLGQQLWANIARTGTETLSATAGAVLQPVPEALAEPRADGSVRLSVAGQVLDASQRPVAGARLDLLAGWFQEKPGNPPNPGDPGKPLAETRTDAAGRFAFREVVSPPPPLLLRPYEPWHLLVRAEGQALTWRWLTAQTRQQPLTITLAPEATLHGQVVAPKGTPLPQVQVRVDQLAPLDHPTTDGPPAAADSLDLKRPAVAPTTRTDAQGRFVLAGLRANQRCVLVCSARGFQEKTLFAATRDRPQAHPWTGLDPCR